MDISRKEFESLVGEALEGLPEEFAANLENVAVVVEDEPSDEDLEAVGLNPEWDTLFGLYQGVALPERGLGYSGLPDRIVIYRFPILDAFDDRKVVVAEIRKTVLHELGHYFGLAEDEIPE
jgi:predicted Zn-dependent protease with MMP-like domain